ncbi:MAG: hypothetical protein Q8R34_01300 [bacterium]|nr:hypothetical protein [bacterium]
MPLSPANKIDSEKLFITLILFTGLALAYLLGSSVETSDVSQPRAIREISPELASVNLDLSVLDDILFKQLKVFGTIPVNPGQTGRDDPFAPF